VSNHVETQFINTFLEEALESLASWETTCLNINKKNEKESLIQLFRIAHNLKGSSASVGLKQFAEYIHKVEELLTYIKNDQINFEINILNLFFEIHTISNDWIKSIQNDINYIHNTPS